MKSRGCSMFCGRSADARESQAQAEQCHGCDRWLCGSRKSRRRRIGGVSTRHLSETGPHEQRFRDHPHLIVFLRYVLCMHGLDFSAAQAVFRKLSSRRIVFKAIDGQTDHMRWISTCTIRKSMVLTWYGHNTIESVLV